MPASIKIWARIITAPGNSFWIRIADATSPHITRADGWINTNPMDGGDAWHWDEIHNDQQDDNVVEFTLPAGEHTLEIAKREDGTLLDALVITDKLDETGLPPFLRMTRWAQSCISNRVLTYCPDGDPPAISVSSPVVTTSR